MKTDQLEEFVRNHRREFDEFDPTPELWDNIEQQLPVRKIIPWKTNLGRAAAILIIFASGYVFSLYVTGRQHEKSTAEMANTTMSPEMSTFFEARAYYSGMISSRKDEVLRLAGNNNDIKKIIEEEFALMDEDYKQLEKDLADQVAADEVIEAMIQHHRIKLELLEDILHQLQTSASAEEKEVHYVL